MSASMTPPPRLHTDDGSVRRIGAEIEFSAVDCREAAALVEARFGGTIEEESAWRFRVRDTDFGDFTVELDTQYAHAHAHAKAVDETDPSASDFERRIADTLDREVSEVIGDIGSLWLPVEIVAPPVPLDRLPELDPLIADLRAAGAEGTDDALLFAFATQLNVEVATRSPESVRDYLKAYLLLAEGLRDEIEPRLTRRLLPFASPFPQDYVRLVVNPAYRPDLGELIDDYLDANPTRNRELDMLPLFLDLDPERVRARITDARVRARPTFHYRLPDTRLSDPGWGLITEWNRWVRVEQLAADPEGLADAGRAYLRHPRSLPRRVLASLRRLFG
jgi:hypothetical protein